jgi:hypothetical protein
MTLRTFLDFLRHQNRLDQAREQNIRHARFTAPHPFERIRQALRGNHAIEVLRSKLQAVPKTRQVVRHFLFLAALREVNLRNSKEGTVNGKRCWWNIMPRDERRKLARAYAAGEWRRGHTARGMQAA